MANIEITEEIKDLQSNVALTLLNDLKAQDKISQEIANIFKDKFSKLHDAVVQSFQNHKSLHQKTQSLRSEMYLEQGKGENASAAQHQNQEILEELNHLHQKIQNEQDSSDKRCEILEFDLNDIEKEKMESQARVIEEEKDTKKKYEPEIERLNSEIKELREEITKREQHIENENKHLNDLIERISEMKKSNEKNLEDKENTYENLMKIKDEPKRLSKNADMLTNAHTLMLRDLGEIHEDITKKEKVLGEQNADLEKAHSRYLEHDGVCQTKKQEFDKNMTLITRLNEDISVFKEKHAELSEEKVKYEIELKTLVRETRRHSDNITTLKKQIENLKKEYKQEENKIHTLKDQTRELEISMEKIKKEEADLGFEIKKQSEIKGDMVKDRRLLEYKRKIILDDTTDKQTEIGNLKKKIVDYEKNIADLQAMEVKAQKTVKDLTALRESMARKASAALLEVKETREELKIKELLILDLTKKQQEIEFKLNSFKALYEEVKSARNKYVNLIQNSSQDLAELKERIKIIQNELEILKNESSEKDKTLHKFRTYFQEEVHKRDKGYGELNKLDYQRRQKKEIVDQQINEIEKQNVILLALEKEMLQLRHQYEVACESRNFTGIQLIDRNDELCILYEKANIQESILRNGERDIQALEDDVRMIKIEISEVKRKIEVSRKTVTVVPGLADQVIQLKADLNREKEKEKELSEALENPENKNRYRDLGGDDPDQEALEAKIQVLEERLNNKKEALLEKELILDEITNLSEKLRSQALEGRQSSLELSEKVNEFQARLKDLTRKMMATISELSMFQATALKLQQEQEQLEKVLDEANERMTTGLPPLPEAEIEYQKIVRDKYRYQQEKEIRVQREMFEKSMPPFAIRTTAAPRVQQYIPVGEMGLPKPYGSHAPFLPSEQGVQLRHFKKPEVKDIEI